MYITIKLVDMRFFDRKTEFEKLGEIEELSYEVAQFTIITGRRRIGKTEMVKKFYENKKSFNREYVGYIDISYSHILGFCCKRKRNFSCL